MEERKEAPLTTETQIEDWVAACRFEFRKIMADPKLQRKALEDNASNGEKNFPLPENLSKDERKLYSAAVSEASAKTIFSASYSTHFQNQYIPLSRSDSTEDQERGQKLMEEAQSFEKTHLFPMLKDEIALHHSLKSDVDEDSYKILSENAAPSTEEWEIQAATIFGQCITDKDELVKAFNSRGGINTNGKVVPLTLETLDAALTAINAGDKSKYTIHDEGRLLCELQNLGVLTPVDTRASDKLRALKTSDILIYDAIAMHTRTEIPKSIHLKLGALLTIKLLEDGLLSRAIEAHMSLLSEKQLAKPVLNTLKELVSDHILLFERLQIKTLKSLTTELRASQNVSAIAICNEVNLLNENRDPNFTLPELIKILQSTQNKEPNDLLNAANKITTLESKTQNYQQLKTGLIIFGASCLIIAAAAATLFSFGILAPITLPLMAVAGSLLVGAVGTLGYKNKEYKNTMSELRKELTQDLKGLIEPAVEKQSSVAEGRESPGTITEDLSRPSTPTFEGSS